jgi:hypothetical protein
MTHRAMRMDAGLYLYRGILVEEKRRMGLDESGWRIVRVDAYGNALRDGWIGDAPTLRAAKIAIDKLSA